MATFTRLKTIAHGPHVIEVSLNRPTKSNAMDTRLWQEVGHYFGTVVPNLTGCRCIVLTGQGRHFSSGIDLQNSPLEDAASGDSGDDDEPNVAVAALRVLRTGSAWQRAWTALTECGRPVIAAVHGACIGAALELISAADIRVCTSDAFFAAPEVDVGIAADIGGLQRFPKIIGNDSLLRELMLTARRMGAAEALSLGLVSHVHDSLESLRSAAFSMADVIASKSPLAVHGIKTLLNYTRDHTVDEALRFAITWNAAMVQSPDVANSIMGLLTKQKPEFGELPALVMRSKL